MARFIDTKTIQEVAAGIDRSVDLSDLEPYALCLTLDEAKELAGVLEWAGDKKFAHALRKWIDSPYRNKGKED